MNPAASTGTKINGMPLTSFSPLTRFQWQDGTTVVLATGKDSAGGFTTTWKAAS